MFALLFKYPRRNVTLGVVALSLVFLLETTVRAQSNDDFANAIELTGTLPLTSDTISNVSASVEEGELDHYFDSIANRSLWWKWTATADERIEVNTTGHDTVLSVYKGSAINALVLIGNNDDDDFTKNSRVRFLAKSGTTYLIAVDGLRDQTKNLSGDVTLEIKKFTSTPPANDNWADALVLTGQPILGGIPLGSGSNNINATVEDGELIHFNTNSHTSTIWWKWKSTATESVRAIADDLQIDTVMSVYTGPDSQVGNDFSSLSLVDANDDGEFSTAAVVEFKAQQDQTYYFGVDGSLIERGAVAFSIEGGQLPPSNDNFANATTVPTSLVTVTVSGRNSGSTSEVNEPDHSGGNIAGNPTSSSWWVWSPEVTTAVEINTFGSLFDTILAVYTGSSVDNLSLLARSDNAGTTQSRVRFTALSTETYYIAVDGKNSAEGPIVLSVIQPGPAKPVNDDFIDLIDLGAGLVVNEIGTNVGGTVEPGEPVQTAEASVWYFWEAPATAKVELDTFGSDFDSTLGVYTGTFGSLNLAGFNDNSGGEQSRVVFPAQAGQGYYIVVGGSLGAEGALDLNLKVLGAYASWVVSHPTLTGSDREPFADKDGDGFTNLEEMAYNLDPEIYSGPEGLDPNKANAPVYIFTSTGMTFVFTIDPVYINTEVNGGAPVKIYGEDSEELEEWERSDPQNLINDLYRVQLDFDIDADQSFVKLNIIDPNGQ